MLGKILYDLTKVIYLYMVPLAVFEGFLVYFVFEFYSVLVAQILTFFLVLFFIYFWWLNWIEILEDYIIDHRLIFIFECVLLVTGFCISYLLAFSVNLTTF